MKKGYSFFLIILLNANFLLAQGLCPIDTTISVCQPSPTQSNGQTINLSNGYQVYPYNFTPLVDCEKKYYNDQMEHDFPNAIPLNTCPNSSYNCHGYAWYMILSGGSQAWIESNQLYKFYTPNQISGDEYFYEVFSEPINTLGVVVYMNGSTITHSALTMPGSNPKTYRSKWGWGYLVEHTPNNVPSDYGAPSRYFLRCGSCITEPNLLAMTYNLGTVSTVNFVPAGGYSIYTNVPACQLSINQNISWSTYGGFSNWGTVGQRKLSAWFSLSAGQSVTFSISAPSNCGTSVRSPAFVAQSGYRMYSSNQVKDRLTIEFDNVDYLEILPQTIVISDEKTGLEEKVISMKELFDGKQFDDKKISIDVKKLSRGMKIVNFFYHNLNSKTV